MITVIKREEILEVQSGKQFKYNSFAYFEYINVNKYEYCGA